MGGSILDRQGTLAGAHCDRKYNLIEIVDRHRTAPEREWNLPPFILLQNPMPCYRRSPVTFFLALALRIQDALANWRL